MEHIENKPELFSENSFPAIKYYIIMAIFFIDIGILFGGLNALRLAEIFNVPEIHQTHWTSTLFGGMTVIMMGQLLYFIGLSIDLPDWVKNSSLAILFLILLAVISNYIQVWFPGNLFGRYFEELIKVASVIYISLVSYVTIKGDRKHALSDEPAYIMIYAAIFWMGISQLIFLGYLGVIGAPFRIPYVYGFFSLTLFGSLSFVLPRVYSIKTRPQEVVLRDTILISLSATLLLLNELLDQPNTLLGLLGTVLWGLVGFIFILYVFDLMFKRGISNSLIGLSIALVMFGFFVFDTLMKSIFPHWVNGSHAHFMFLGTLVITILSVGIQVIGKEIALERRGNTAYSIILFTSVFLIGCILLGFTLQLFGFAGYSGILLFFSLISYEGYFLFKLNG